MIPQRFRAWLQSRLRRPASGPTRADPPVEKPESWVVPVQHPPNGIAVLVADDVELLVQSCARVLSGDGYTVHAAGSGEEALDVLRRHRPDIVLADVELPGLDGTALLKEIGETAPGTVVVMITGPDAAEPAVAALRAGAWDCIPRPFTATVLRGTIRTAAEQVKWLRRCARRGEQLRKLCGFENVVAASGAMREVLATVRRAAPTDAGVFISGEGGTGQRLFARMIHAHSRRSARPFISVHCAALTDRELEAELFGLESYSCTHGHREKRGLLEVAGDGTLFLNELPEMGPGLQKRLLRAIGERRFRRVGGETEIPLTARFVAASRDPEAAVRDGSLLPDLLQRLGEVRVKLPPLRERREDIPPLAERFLRRYAQEQERRDLRFSPEALRVLEDYPWPGNVRELKMVVMLAVSRCPPGQEIRPDDLPGVLAT